MSRPVSEQPWPGKALEAAEAPFQQDPRWLGSDGAAANWCEVLAAYPRVPASCTAGPLKPSFSLWVFTVTLPVQNHLAGLSGLHQLERLIIVADVKVMRDDWADVEAALQHAGHLVPGLEHLPSIDPF